MSETQNWFDILSGQWVIFSGDDNSEVILEFKSKSWIKSKIINQFISPGFNCQLWINLWIVNCWVRSDKFNIHNDSVVVDYCFTIVAKEWFMPNWFTKIPVYMIHFFYHATFTLWKHLKLWHYLDPERAWLCCDQLGYKLLRFSRFLPSL